MKREHPVDASTVAAICSILREKMTVEAGSAETDLLQAGILDSLALIQFLVHLEETFGVKIPLDELDIEDIRTVSSIAGLVEKAQAEQLASSPGARDTAVAVNR